MTPAEVGGARRKARWVRELADGRLAFTSVVASSDELRKVASVIERLCDEQEPDPQGRGEPPFAIVTNHDDWLGVYRKGRLVAEGHLPTASMPMKDFLELFGVAVTVEEVKGDWLAERGRLPRSLDQVVMANEEPDHD